MAKKIFFSVVILAGGALAGYYLNSYTGAKSASECPVFDRVGEGAAASQREKAILKLDLLKDYTNLVYLPEGSISDVNAYVSAMDQKINAIADDAITEKYYATGSGEEREAKILDFFNFLIEETKKDLNQ